MDEEKVIEHKWEDGALADICEALRRSEDIVRTADEVTDDNAKFKLLEGVNIILDNCINAIKERAKNGEILTNTPVIEEQDD